jgi:adenine specific DNA methylase Mod
VKCVSAKREEKGPRGTAADRLHHLRPQESINFETTGNIFIEGDNLEVLKLLFKSYFGRVKLIYIDPPSNTGQDSFTRTTTLTR